jgi:hypothetical protein
MRKLLIAAVLLLAPSFLFAQSLGEVAAREKARREKVAKGKSTPVITESDLGSRTGGTVSHPEATDTDAATATPTAKEPAKGAKKEKTEDEIRAEGVQQWRDKLQKARTEEARLQSRISELQAVLGVPAPNYGSRSSAVSQLEQARRDLATTQAQIASLEDEGRRAGYR